MGSLFRINIVFICTAILFGCATLNKKECESADWQLIGYEDGAAGYAPTRIGDHRKACSKYNISPDMNAYESGRERGLKVFCVPQRGYQLGASGKTYGGVCPKESESEFLASYKQGRLLYEKTSLLHKKQNELTSSKKELSKVKQDLETKERLLIQDHVPSAQRQILLSETKELAKQQGGLEEKIKTLEKEIVQIELEAKQLQVNKSVI